MPKLTFPNRKKSPLIDEDIDLKFDKEAVMEEYERDN